MLRPSNSLGRHAHGFKPTADIHLSVGFAAEMPGGRTRGGGQIPFDNRELLICALDHKPMDRILTDRPANLASDFTLDMPSPMSDGSPKR